MNNYNQSYSRGGGNGVGRGDRRQSNAPPIRGKVRGRPKMNNSYDRNENDQRNNFASQHNKQDLRNNYANQYGQVPRDNTNHQFMQAQCNNYEQQFNRPLFNNQDMRFQVTHNNFNNQHMNGQHNIHENHFPPHQQNRHENLIYQGPRPKFEPHNQPQRGSIDNTFIQGQRNNIPIHKQQQQQSLKQIRVPPAFGMNNKMNSESTPPIKKLEEPTRTKNNHFSQGTVPKAAIDKLDELNVDKDDYNKEHENYSADKLLEIEKKILSYYSLIKNYKHPSFIAACCKKLATTFETCPNSMRIVICKAFEDISSFIDKDISLDYIIPDLISIHNSNDTVGKSISLRILSYIAKGIGIDNYLYYIVIKSLSSEDYIEVSEALSLSKVFIGLSTEFAEYILPFYGDMLGLDCNETKIPFSEEKELKKITEMKLYLRIVDTLKTFKNNLTTAIKARSYCLELLEMEDVKVFSHLTSSLIFISSELSTKSEVHRMEQADYLLTILMQSEKEISDLSKTNVMAALDGLLLLARSKMIFEEIQIDNLIKLLNYWEKSELLISKILMLIKYALKSLDLNNLLYILGKEEHSELKILDFKSENEKLNKPLVLPILGFSRNFIQPLSDVFPNGVLAGLVKHLLLKDYVMGDYNLLSKIFPNYLIVIQIIYHIIVSIPDIYLRVGLKKQLALVCTMVLFIILKKFISFKDVPVHKTKVVLDILTNFLIFWNERNFGSGSFFEDGRDVIVYQLDAEILFQILKALKVDYFKNDSDNLKMEKENIFDIINEWLINYGSTYFNYDKLPSENNPLIEPKHLDIYLDYPQLFPTALLLALKIVKPVSPFSEFKGAREYRITYITDTAKQISHFGHIDKNSRLTKNIDSIIKIGCIASRLSFHYLARHIFNLLYEMTQSDFTRTFLHALRYWNSFEFQISSLEFIALKENSSDNTDPYLKVIKPCLESLKISKECFKDYHNLIGRRGVSYLSWWVELRADLINLFTQFLNNIILNSKYKKGQDFNLEDLKIKYLNREEQLKAFIKKAEFLASFNYSLDTKSYLFLSLWVNQIYTLVFILRQFFNIEYKDLDGNGSFPTVYESYILNMSKVRDQNLEFGFNTLKRIMDKNYKLNNNNKLLKFSNILIELIANPCPTPLFFFQPCRKYSIVIKFDNDQVDVLDNKSWPSILLKGKVEASSKDMFNEIAPTKLKVIIEYCPKMKETLPNNLHQQSQLLNYINPFDTNSKYPKMEYELPIDSKTLTFTEVIALPKDFILKIRDLLRPITGNELNNMENHWYFSSPDQPKYLRLKFMMFHPEKKAFFLDEKDYFLLVSKEQSLPNEH